MTEEGGEAVRAKSGGTQFEDSGWLWEETNLCTHQQKVHIGCQYGGQEGASRAWRSDEQCAVGDNRSGRQHCSEGKPAVVHHYTQGTNVIF